MKFLLRFVFSLLIVHPIVLFSQTRVEFSDDFNDNSNEWLVDLTANREYQIRNGEYSLNKLVGEGSSFIWRNVPLVSSRDWTIQVRLKLVSGAEDRGYGVIFNTKNVDSSFVFVISANGYARVYRWIGNDLTSLIAWRKSPCVKGKGETNVLRIEHRFDVTAFFVNDVCIGSCTSSEYDVYGDRLGFLVENVMHVSVDQIVVSSSPADGTVNSVSSGGIALTRTNLGPKVNSSSTELSAIISADGKQLYYIRRLHPANTGNDKLDDIWLSTKDANNVWTEAENVGSPMNNSGNNAVISITPDNNTLLLHNTYNADGTTKGGGMSITHRTATGWEVPKTIEIDSNYNLNQYEEFCLSPDGKVLVSSIEQYDTKGSKDLYVSFRTSDTSFARPQRISQLSTIGTDMAPFVASDGMTMYFSSNGRAGFGGQDIFVTQRLDSTWMRWTEPKNLGNEINTDSFDAYFRTTARGDSAYLITYSSSLGGGDIVRIAVPPDARPKKVCLISGHVYDAKSKKPLGAGVIYEFLETNREAGLARSNPRDGAYSIVLPAGNIYGFRATAEGYYPVSEQLDTRNLSGYEEINRDLYLVPIEVGAKIRLNNLFFDFAKFDLRSESASELDRLIDFLQKSQQVQLLIEGHTDNVGDDKKNLLLSQNRAMAVMHYLSSKGVDASRITSKGYGKSNPIDSNQTEEGRQKNRRVEIVITKK